MIRLEHQYAPRHHIVIVVKCDLQFGSAVTSASRKPSVLDRFILWSIPLGFHRADESVSQGFSRRSSAHKRNDRFLNTKVIAAVRTGSKGFFGATKAVL